MKRIVLCGLSTLSALVVLFGYHTSTSSVMATGTEPAFTRSLAAQSASGTTSGQAGGSAPPADGSSTGSAASTVTGDAAQTRWGPVQVQLAVDGSTITDVSILQYPDSNGRDIEINRYALPQLIQQTLDAQGSDISMVSGATYTSQGYLQSLQSALDRAGL